MAKYSGGQLIQVYVSRPTNLFWLLWTKKIFWLRKQLKKSFLLILQESLFLPQASKQSVKPEAS